MDDLRQMLVDMLAEHLKAMEQLRTEKPSVTDGHSDGKRVRFVRHEAAAEVLKDVIAMVAGRA